MSIPKKKTKTRKSNSKIGAPTSSATTTPAIVEATEGDFAYFLTLMLSAINPQLHRGETYEILYGLVFELGEGASFTDQDAIDIGLDIAETCARPMSKGTH